MDEAEKYKQRLEAIAEKRRLQEEEEKARREIEDEKLRLQQLKRKSLRDQWLMEAAPLSPASPDAQAPRSPSWNTQAQDMKTDTDKLQLAEEPEEPEEPIELGQMEVVTVAEDAKEMVQSVVQNGQNSNGPCGHEETAEGDMKAIPRPALDDTSISGNMEPNTYHSVSVQNSQSTTNGLIRSTTAVGDMKLDQRSSVDEPQPGQAQNDNVIDDDEEEEEGTLVTRAECVIITDEGDDASQEGYQDDVHQQEETCLVNEKEDEEEAVQEFVKTKTFTGSEKDEAAVLGPEAQLAAENGDTGGGQKLITNGEGTVEHEDIQVGNRASVQLQFSANAPEGTVETLPVYSEGQPSVLTPVPQAEGEASAAPERAEAALQAEKLVHQAGQFQDVSLADPQEKNCTEEGPKEQEPLLSRTAAQPVGIHRPASSETQSPPRAQGPADEAKEPKRKNCQCCSVM